MLLEQHQESKICSALHRIHVRHRRPIRRDYDRPVPLAIFDLDNTLVDRAGSFRRWAESFVAQRGLAAAEVGWLEGADGDGFTPRHEFMAAVRDRYGLREPVDALVDRFRKQLVALV